MSLSWVRLDTSFPTHDKVLELVEQRGGREAGFVYLCGLAYAGLHESDGLIPFGALPIVHAKRRDADLLVAAGMWKPHPRGWEIVNWSQRNQSGELTGKVRRAQSLGATKANCIRWHGPDCGCWEDGGTESVD